MPGMPDIQAKLDAMVIKQADMEAQLALLTDNLEAIALASANGASVPQLIDLTDALAGGVNGLIDSLKDWGEGAVSRTYVPPTLPPPVP